MKKLLSTLWMALFLLSIQVTVAYADIVKPGQPVENETINAWPFILIGVALIVAAIVLHWMRRKK